MRNPFPALWYRKRDDAEANYFARQCNVSTEFEIVGDVIHRDDLPGVLRLLDITHHCALDLFTPLAAIRPALVHQVPPGCDHRGVLEVAGVHRDGHTIVIDYRKVN